MSVGSDENTELLRERDRLPGKMALSLRQAQAATGSTVIWVPEEVDALHIFRDEVESALVQSWLVVRQAKSKCPLWTSGDGHPVGGGEEAASWSWKCRARNKGNWDTSVGQEQSACGVVLEEDQVAPADVVDTA